MQRVCRRLGVLCLLTVAPSLRAQSVSIDAEEPPPSVAPTAPAPTPPPPPPAPVIERPVAKRASVAYPEGATGREDVVLELTISREGKVTEATLVSGRSPFAEQALAAAPSFEFEPARRNGQPVAAKVRFMVSFTPEEPVPEAAPPAPVAAPPPSPAEQPVEAPLEVTVIGEPKPLRQSLGQAEVRDMPGAFGDPYRAIEALPGVVPIASGVPYFYVRGAPPGNVGYFFDGIPVPLLYHFAAGPGVLHPAFVDRVDLYPGAYPARYGRYAGGIVAGEMAEPTHELRGEASIRLIDSGGMLEVPFADSRGSVMLGGRFSYTGLVLSLIVPEVTLNYWDYQGRVRYAVDGDDSVEALFFGSGDFLAENRPSGRQETIVDVGFHRLDLRWDRRLPDGNWRNAMMFGLDRTRAAEGEVIVSNYLVGARSELVKRLAGDVTLRAGGDVLFEWLRQNVEEETDPEPGSEEPNFGFDPNREDLTTGVWADLVIDATEGVEVTPGLRLDAFVSSGKLAFGVDPRIAARFEVQPKLTLVHGLALVHQAPSFVVPIPGLKPSLAGGLQRAVQHSAGVEYALPAGISSSATLFHNVFFNMTDLISLIQLANTTGDDVDDFRTMGRAYGFELMLRRSLTQRVGGFVSYTLSRSERWSGVLQGPATTDRTHVLNLALSLDLGKNWRFGSRCLFYSGIPAHVAYLEAAKNPPRTPLFWRVDWKLQKRWYIAAPNAWWGLAFEVLNTTLNKEVLDGSCNAFECRYEEIGPVTIPSIGAEGAF